MKRILICILMLVLFCGCSGTGSHDTTDSTTDDTAASAFSGQAPASGTVSQPAAPFGAKYDYIDCGIISIPSFTRCTSSFSLPSIISTITGGALDFFPYESFYSDTAPFATGADSDRDDLLGLYDEETNSLIPLCFVPSCTHDAEKQEEKCFAQSFYGQYGAVRDFGVLNGEIFVVGTNLDVKYYSFEGTLVSSQVKCTLFRQQMHTFSRPVFSL